MSRKIHLSHAAATAALLCLMIAGPVLADEAPDFTAVKCAPGDPLCSDIKKDAQVPAVPAKPQPKPESQETGNTDKPTFDADKWRKHEGGAVSLQSAPSDKPLATTKDTPDGYEYNFNDDGLNAATSLSDQIKVQNHHYQSQAVKCLDDWLGKLRKRGEDLNKKDDELAKKKGDSSASSVMEASALKADYQEFLRCQDDCLTSRDLDVLSGCADWDAQAKLLSGEADMEQLGSVLEGGDMFACDKKVITQAVRLGMMDNRRRQPNGKCEIAQDIPDFSVGFLSLAVGVGDLATCKGNCSNTNSGLVTAQQSGFITRRTDDLFYLGSYDANVDYMLQPPTHATRATLVGYRFGGDVNADFGMYKTLLGKGYTCTPIAGGRATGHAGADGDMANTRLLDSAIQAGVGIVCSGKSFGVAIIGDADLGRGTVFALYPGEIAPGMSENVRGVFSRIGQGGSGQVALMSKDAVATVEAGTASYSTSLHENEKYLLLNVRSPFFFNSYIGPSLEGSQYSAQVPGLNGEERPVKDTDLRAQVVIGFKW